MENYIVLNKLKYPLFEENVYNWKICQGQQPPLKNSTNF
jgi:hypothetical protein